MQDYIALLQQLPLFQKISAHDLVTMMDCFCGEICTFQKGDILSSEKNIAFCLLTGHLGTLPQGVFISPEKEDASYEATEAGLLLKVDHHMLHYPCYGCCFFHAQLLENMKP